MELSHTRCLMHKLTSAILVLLLPNLCAAQAEPDDRTAEVRAIQRVLFLVGTWAPADEETGAARSELSIRTITAADDGRSLIISSPNSKTDEPYKAYLTYSPGAQVYEINTETKPGEKLRFKATLAAPGHLQVDLPKWPGYVFDVKVAGGVWTETILPVKNTDGLKITYEEVFKRQYPKEDSDKEPGQSKLIRGKSYDEWIAQVRTGKSLGEREDALQVLRNEGLGRYRERTLQVFTQALSADEPTLQSLAAAGLRKAGLPTDPEAPGELVELISEADAGISPWGKQFPGFTEIKPEAGATLRAISALGAIGDKSHIPALRQISEDNRFDRLPRQMADRAIRQIETRLKSKSAGS